MWAIALVFFCMTSSSAVTLKEPGGLTFDDEDRLIVADTGNDRILVFTPALELKTIVGKSGTENGEFQKVQDVVQLPGGRYAVADAGNHRIQVFDAHWRFLFAFGRKGRGKGEFKFPANISADSRGRMVVSDRLNHRLQVFSPKGKHLFTFSNREGDKPRDVETPDKQPSTQWRRIDPGQLNEPGGVFIDEDLGRIYVANGWNCRIEQLQYDVQSGFITRMEKLAEDGIIWGFWITRSLAGDEEGRILGLQSAFGEIKVFENRAALNSKSKPTRVITGGGFGRLKNITDIAINSRGEVAVADCNHNRIVLLPTDLTVPEDVRVREITRSGALISWRTRTPCSTEILLRKGGEPQYTPSRPDPWSDGREPPRKVRAQDRQRCHIHELQLKGLKPGQKYYYRVRLPEMFSIPPSEWSREYAINTRARKGETEYLALTLKVLLLPNVLYLPSLQADTPFPEPMPEPDYERLYAASFRETQLFYWVNSRMKLYIDFDFYVDPTFYGKDQAPDDAPGCFANLPVQKHAKSFEEAVVRAGKGDELYYGQLICECERRWNTMSRSWYYQGSGGGTHYIDWPKPGKSHFLGGSDVAWLMCHEYKHQVESNFKLSGMNREDDRMWFCHFASAHPGWAEDTAADHGEHWDGIAWQLRNLTIDQQLRLMYADLRTARDRDNDGIPDHAPELPLDEKRFGSDPLSQDGDGDGLTDMEEALTSTWVRCMNAPVRSKIGLEYIRPGPQSSDTDGDGIPDGLDRYPIYPFRSKIAGKVAEVDGRLSEWKEAPFAFLEGFGQKADLWAGWSNDYFYLAFALEGDAPQVRVVFDFLANGFYVGNDNLELRISGGNEKGATLRDAKLHLGNMGCWPFFDKRAKETGRYTYFNPDELLFASRREGSRTIVEIGVPKREPYGLFLKDEEEIGIMFYVEVPGKGNISLTEPWTIFDFVLTGSPE